MPRLPLIIATSLVLTTLGGCASEVVSSARESKATTTPAIANAAAESPAEPPATPPPTTARPVPPAAKPPAAPGKTTAPPTTTVTPAGGADLTAVTDPQLGKLVADQNGMTTYFLSTDPAKPPQSTCLDDCAKLWPPILLPASGSVRVDGIDAKLLGKLTRPDRTIQLTLAGHPLYRFIGDTTPGDTLGNGLAGTAFAISPAGAAATTAKG